MGTAEEVVDDADESVADAVIDFASEAIVLEEISLEVVEKVVSAKEVMDEASDKVEDVSAEEMMIGRA